MDDDTKLPVVVPVDELSGEVAIRAHIDDTGLTVAGKSRALSAADRLLGGLLGIPAAYVEGIRRRMELDNQVREALIRVQGQRAVEALEGIEDIGRATAARFAAEEARKQLNREAVWGETIASIKALPPPTPGAPEDEAPTVDEDWINMFASHAEKASSERLRQLWGRILAGEIRKPGSFAPSTLRVISELDAEIANAFQEVIANRLGNGALLKPSDFKSEELLKFTFLEEVGLLQEVNGSLTICHNRTSKGNYGVIDTDNFYIQITMPDGVNEFSYPVIRITRVGQQIASILPWDEVGALKACADSIKGNFEIVLGRVASRHAGGLVPVPMETIRKLN